MRVIRKVYIQMKSHKQDSDYPIVKRSIAKDKIGDMLHYSRCECGKSWYYAEKNNPGEYLGNGKGKVMCNECYLKDRERIDNESRARMSKERWIYPVKDGDDLEVAPPIW